MAEGGAGPSDSSSSTSDDAKLAELLSGPGFAVYPLPWCPHLEEGVGEAPATVSCSAPCTVCQDTKENWKCLACHATHCSRYVSGHQVDHHAASLHPLALSYSDLSVWCFVCDSYVDHELLFEVKDRAHQDKFGEPMLKPDYGKVEEGATFQMI